MKDSTNFYIILWYVQNILTVYVGTHLLLMGLTISLRCKIKMCSLSDGKGTALEKKFTKMENQF